MENKDLREEKWRELGEFLKAEGYSFVTPTPESHRRVLLRREGGPGHPPTLRDVFGWNRLFRKNQLPPRIFKLLEETDALERTEGGLKSRIRFSTLGEDLFLHSSYPTAEASSVFFGPDTYRFASLIRRELESHPLRVRRLIDVGCGSGAGPIAALRCLPDQIPEVVFADVNPRALSYARVNAALARVEKASFFLSDALRDVPGPADLILANPPYLIDPEARLYRHGGGDFGEGLSVRIAAEAVGRLAPGGRFILYTGTAVVGGTPVLLQSLRNAPAFSKIPFRYEEIDPDVFGEELEKLHYQGAERIAAVSVTASSPDGGLKK